MAPTRGSVSWLLLSARLVGVAALHLDRRLVTAALGGAASSLLGPCAPARAISEGGVQWTLDLPDSFAVSQRLASIVRIKTQPMLVAEDPSGATAKLLLLPFGQQAGASLDADEQLRLAKFFFDAEVSLSADLEPVVAALASSASRSPSVLSLTRFNQASARASSSGRRYVRYEYATKRCAGELDGGECFGTTTARKTLATVTMSSISQYRTNTERERMKELGQSRNVQVLWLLTLSAPDGAAYEKLAPAFERASKSFEVPDVEG